MTEQLASTENILHPRQVSELNETKKKLEKVLGAAPYIRDQLQDGGAMVAKQIHHIDRTLEQAPKPYAPEEIDTAVQLEQQLRDGWIQGMPTQAEMRRNPSGAVDKHRSWEKANKDAVLKWKHVRRRLHASGISEYRLADEGDISNIEKFRPVGGAQELNMDNAQIPGTNIHLPPAGLPPAVVVTEEDMAALRAISPEVAEKVPLLSAEQRQQVLDIIHGKPSAASAATPAKQAARRVRKKRVMTQGTLDALKRGRETAAANRAARKAAEAEG